MSEYLEDQFIIGTMKWSFSRLNSFYNNCRYEWYQHYIQGVQGGQGFFGAYGGFCHKCLEKYLKGELDIFTLSQYYADHFLEEVPYDAPANKYTDIKANYYQKGLEYFDNIDIPIDEYEIVGVEKQVDFEIEGYQFIGFIDLLLRDPKDGKYILVDHKSGTIKRLKDGSISKTDFGHFLAFRRQLYLYLKAVQEEFGKGCVKELWWNMFKDRGWIKKPYSDAEYQEALDWAVETIHEIEQETEWLPKADFYYCHNLCSIQGCPYKE